MKLSPTTLTTPYFSKRLFSSSSSIFLTQIIVAAVLVDTLLSSFTLSTSTVFAFSLPSCSRPCRRNNGQHQHPALITCGSNVKRISKSRHYSYSFSLFASPAAATTTSKDDNNVKKDENKNPFDFLSSLFPSQKNKESLSQSSSSSASGHKILLLGSTGFVGTAISKELAQRNLPFVGISLGQENKQEEEEENNNNSVNIQLDLTSTNATNQLSQILKHQRCTAVISTVGSLKGNSNDYDTNACSGKIASCARKAGVSRFVYVGNAPRVKEVIKDIPFFKNYREGKIKAEELIQQEFNDKKGSGGGSYCIICPTFIYGGKELSLQPPRLPETIGAFAEEVLGLYPLQALADVMPGLIGIALESPVSVESIAKACVNAAVGLCDDFDYLDTKEDIVMVASKRPPPSLQYSNNNNSNNRGFVINDEKLLEEKRKEIKTKLIELGDGNEQAFALIEELEYLKPPQTKPAYDHRLNGPWDFNFSVEPDLGTGVVKSLLEKEEEEKSFLFSLDSVCMEIRGNEEIEITVETRVLRVPVELKLFTSLEVVDDGGGGGDDDEDGTMFMEKFEGASLFGINLPIPKSWKRSRYLEFSYLDDDMVVARGNGREPHFLLRKTRNEKITEM